MISFESVTKRFPDGTTAVDNLNLEVPEGDLSVLVGPSGCGKTTTLRMINRMIEATSGRIVVDGRDVATVDPLELRRRIGYVIQQVGLFSHRTIAENIGIVPELVGWDRSRTSTNRPTSSSSSPTRWPVRRLSQPTSSGTVAMFSPMVRCGNRPICWMT